MKAIGIIGISCIAFFAFIEDTNSAKILFLTPVSTRSENHFYESFIRELAQRGHELQVITSIDILGSNSHRNISVLVPSTSEEQWGPFSNVNYNYTPWNFLSWDFEDVARHCHKVFRNKQFQSAINQKYDLVITNVYLGRCFNGVLHKVGAPYIFIDSWASPNFILTDFGNYFPPAYVPHGLLHYTDEMTFSERVHNFLIDWMMIIREELIIRPKMERIYREYLGSSVPPMKEIHKKASMFLMNTDISVNFHRPLLPDIVEIGCIHCEPPKPLPQELENFIGNGSEGFIVFSLGTVLSTMTMPEAAAQKILRVFEKLKQKVLWKWETEEMKGIKLPSNVMLKKFLPQQDLLGHPKIKLFVSHGGLLSSQQVVYHGVPALFFPVFFDQVPNSKRAVNSGYALRLNIMDFTEEEFETAVKRLLTDSRFKETVKRVSQEYHDRVKLAPPKSTAAFWTEYVLKHNGASNLKSAARNLNLFQIASLDVIAFLLGSAWLAWKIIASILLKLMSSCLKKPNQLSLKNPKRSQKRNKTD